MSTEALGAIVGFLAGSIPFGLLIATLAGRGDPRKAGSGNVGATNVARTGGFHLGVLTLLLDAGKGAIPAWLLLGQGGPTAGCTAGLAAVLGHCFSPWLRFRGGKGVATLLGIVGVLLWPWGLVVFAVAWLGFAAALRWASVASLVASWAMPLVAALAFDSKLLAATMGVAAAIVSLRHHSNIKRLLRGEEPPFGRKPSREEAA